MLCLAGRETLARAGLKQKLHLKIIKHTSIRKFKVSPACHVQMSNVSMVKLLSERTSGVPPVIFSFQAQALMAHTLSSHKVLNIENCCWLPDTVVQHCQDRVAYAPCLQQLQYSVTRQLCDSRSLRH